MKEILSINLWIDSNFINELLSTNASSQEILDFIQIDLAHESFIQKNFKKELKIFKRIRKDYDLYDAYQICFNYKQMREQFLNQWLKPLIYPIFLYVLAWVLMCTLIWFMIPRIQAQLPQIELQFPNEIIVFTLGIQIGCLLIFVLIKIFFKDQYYRKILNLKVSLINVPIKFYLSYSFLISTEIYLEKGILLIDTIDINRYHPNKFLGFCFKETYKYLKEGNSLTDSFTLFDKNLVLLISKDKTTYNAEQFKHLKILYETVLNRFFKLFKQTIQLLSYSMIGLLVLLSYQVVLLPLRMIEELL